MYYVHIYFMIPNNIIGRGGLAITMVTQYDIERVKHIESKISKLF